MSHYEERLERDLARVRGRVADMAGLVQQAVKNAMHALQTGNVQLAAATILSDHKVNRTMREIDRLCHGFIALHLPSAGHLRLLSSIIRANIELERIGDYAVTIAREAIALSEAPGGSMASELERITAETLHMLNLSVKAFNELNPDMARATMVMEEQMENNLDLIYSELMANDDHEKVKSLLAMFAVFNQLKRVADQAKNLCEEAVFAATGDTKSPKVYHILFVDEDNSCQSQIAEAVARKYFPGSGVYTSAGRNPAPEISKTILAFLEEHGVELGGLKPKPMDLTPLEISSQHVIVSLHGPVASYFEQIPFHTTPVQWDVAPAPDGNDPAQVRKTLEEIYRDIAVQVRDMMELLRGEEAV